MHTPPTTQPNLRDLPLRRIRFLRLHRRYLEANAFQLRAVFERGRDALAGAACRAGGAEDLHQGREAGSRGGELALGWSGWEQRREEEWRRELGSEGLVGGGGRGKRGAEEMAERGWEGRHRGIGKLW